MAGERPHVVIVGGGFAGLTAVRALRRAPVRVTLVDRRNHHVFQPLLYQVATAGLSAPDIAAPIRHILRRQKNATVLLAEVTQVDLAQHTLRLDTGDLAYDFLILASGATHSYFGHDEWEAFAPGLKTLEDALDIRRRVLLAFEMAERETDPQRRAEWLTFVVIGGGPTGVELAGTLGEIAGHTLRREFRRIDPRDARVLLLEGADRVLLAYTPALSARAKTQLEHLGVEVRTGALVTGVDEGGVWLGAERIPSRAVVWAAGVAASGLGRSLGVPLDRAGRVKVEPDLTVPGHPDAFVVGDLAFVPGKTAGTQVPGVAPAAMQMGRHAVKNILRALDKQPLRPFSYVDKGILATIGRRAGVGMVAGLQISGPLAWLAWLGIHIFFLIGFRNRFVVMVDWIVSYFTYQRSARLLFGDPPTSAPPRAARKQEQ